MDSQVQELLQNSLTRSRFLQQEARSTQQPHANTSYQGDYDELVSAPSASSVDSNGGKEQIDEEDDEEQAVTRTPRPLASLLSDLAISVCFLTFVFQDTRFIFLSVIELDRKQPVNG